MKKRLLALLCVLVLLLSAVPAASALEGESRRAAGTLMELGLIDAVPPGEALDAPAARYEASRLLARLGGAPLSELPAGAQYYVVSKGWVTVTSGQKEPIPTGEFCASLLRMLGYEGFTDENAGLFARRVALTSRDYGETLTLGELYQLVRDAMYFPDSEGTALARRLVEQGLCTEERIREFFPEELTARQIADRHMAAAFRLDVYYTNGAFGNDIRSNGGSGFFVTADGLAVTNCHTIEDALYANVSLITGETFPVEEVLFYDADADLALLRVSRTSTGRKRVVPSRTRRRKFPSSLTWSSPASRTSTGATRSTPWARPWASPWPSAAAWSAPRTTRSSSSASPAWSTRRTSPTAAAAAPC